MLFNVTNQIERLRLKAMGAIQNRRFIRIANLAICAFLGFFGIMFIAGAAHAFTAPTSGSFAYTVYDVAINQILKGPIGFVGGVGAMVLGAIMAIQQKIPMAIPSILGGAVLINADTLVTTLGMTF